MVIVWNLSKSFDLLNRWTSPTTIICWILIPFLFSATLPESMYQ